MSWVNDLAKRRAPLVTGKPEQQVGASKPKAKVEADEQLLALGAAGLSESLLHQYGASLKPTLEDARAVFSTAATLRPHRAAQFQRALERFYADLGKNLNKQPEASRELAAKVAIHALRTLVERVGAGEAVVGGIAALGAMLFVGSTKPAEIQARGQAASAVLEQTLDGLEGRTGANTILFGMRNLIELAVKEQKGLGLAEHKKLWSQIADLHLRTTAPSGAEQADVGRLATLFIQQLKQTRDPFMAIMKSEEQAILAHAGTCQAILDRLAAEPALPAGSPGRTAYSAISQALAALLEQHRAGPASMLQAVEALVVAIPQHAARFTAANVAAKDGLVAVINAVAGSVAADSVLRHLSTIIPELCANPAAAAPLLAVKTAEDVPLALVQSKAVALRQPVGVYDDALKSLDRLPLPIRQRAAIAALPYINNAAVGRPLLEALPAFARHTDTLDAVVAFAASFAAGYPTLLASVGAVASEAQIVASALAVELNGVADKVRLQALNAALQGIMRSFPKTSVASLLRPSGKGESSLLELKGKNDLGRDASQIFGQLLPGVVACKPPDELKANYLRSAITIANNLARLDREPAPVQKRIVADWTLAGAQPELLHFAIKQGGALDVRAQGQATVLGFLEAHPELPPEVAITAGLVLSSEQLGWLLGQIKNTHSHGRVRELRDLVFALAEAKRLDLFDAIAATADPKVAARTIQYVALEYRQDRLKSLPIDALIEGLKKGEDPVAKIEAEAKAAALAAIGVGGDIGPLDAAGLAELKGCQDFLQGMSSVLTPDVTVFGDPSDNYRQVYETCLRETATGVWPHFKYESPIGVEQLKGLTPKQRALWMQEDVTTSQAKAPAPVAQDGIAPTLALLSGLAQVLPKFDLSSKALGRIGWDAASRNKLGKKYEALIAELRRHEKGSPDHRTASMALRPVGDRLALLDLYLVIQAAIAPPKPADQMLLAVKALLPAARGAAERLTGTGVSQAIADLAAEASQVKVSSGSTREGASAADEHHVSAFLTAFEVGCISAKSGSNRASMVELMASAQYKMGRAFQGKVPVGRTILRLMQVEIGKYKGYALRIDQPKGTGTGAMSAEHIKLLYAHAIKKALAMGIPCLLGADGGAAAMLGVKMVPVKGTFHFHRGHTGVHHTQGLQLGHYFTAWAGVKADNGSVGFRAGKDGQCAIAGAMSAVWPPGVVH